MTAEKAGLLRNTWNARNGGKTCSHSRMIEGLEPKNQRNRHSVVCRECGAIIPDPYKQFAMNLAAHAS